MATDKAYALLSLVFRREIHHRYVVMLPAISAILPGQPAAGAGRWIWFGDEVGTAMHSIEDVSEWLRGLDYERFVPEFVANEIDAEVLLALDVNDLVAMQIPLGPAKKILWAIEELHAPNESSLTAPAPVDVGSGDAPAANSNPMLRDADRRQVTVMFCDMVGSTALSAQFDPEDLSAIMLSFLECCTNTARRYDAHIARDLGDGLMIYFGYPHARENDAERALRVALEMLRDVSA